ncbi:RNA-binding S4 domain-containing protein [Lutimaribacter marinistellae]|uniref:RNA-binding S4 domain-containing protein n=1 Tax=Lutimaribacter marinistellae TaxID=1820329 RepID=A0ABV7TLJ8_9RHOB
MSEPRPRLRLDKWLWYARFFKTRGLAAAQVGGGHVRINGKRAEKPAAGVSPGDVLTFAQAGDVRVVRVEALGTRRGPAPEAQTLYTDLSPPKEPGEADVPANPRFEGKGRPTKKDRRALDLSGRKGGD